MNSSGVTICAFDFRGSALPLTYLASGVCPSSYSYKFGIKTCVDDGCPNGSYLPESLYTQSSGASVQHVMYKIVHSFLTISAVQMTMHSLRCISTHSFSPLFFGFGDTFSRRNITDYITLISEERRSD